MVELKTRAEIAAIREAGRFIASVLTSVREQARIGMTLLDLDAIAHQMIDDAGARSVYLGYHPTLRRDPVPRGAVHVGERRRAARPALAVRAGRR